MSRIGQCDASGEWARSGVARKRFNGKCPVRRSMRNGFARVGGEEGLPFQPDRIARAGEWKMTTSSVSGETMQALFVKSIFP